MNLTSYLDFATDLAYRAGQITLGYFRTGVRPDYKADDTPVTAADRAAEQFIRGEIEKAYPDHAILGEEFGESASKSDFRWIVDPIDGTKSFMRGVPLYGVLLGLEIEGVVRVGAAYYPGTDEMLCAADGEGCWWNGRRARVSDATSLARAIVCYTSLTKMSEEERGGVWMRFQQRAYACRGWSDCYGYLLVATGRAEVTFDPAMNPWDCGPFPPILREAGGYFGDWRGNETHLAGEALATTQTLLPQVLDLIRGD